MAKLVRDDEEQLIARSQRGDVNAFNQLVLRYQQMTYGAVLRMLGDADVAADITQDAFIGAFVETGQGKNPEEYLLSQELQELIQRGLQELPLDQRIAVVLCDIQGLSYEEIATTTQATLGTVRSRIARGRARLRNYLYQYRELFPRNYRLPTNTD